MGNRAHVIFEAGGRCSPATYLHWNGGPESVYRLLDELIQRTGGVGDPDYASARFMQVAGEFFDSGGQDGMCLGATNGPEAVTLDALRPYDHGDNGVYVVSPAADQRGDYYVRRYTRSGDSLREWPADVAVLERVRSNDVAEYAGPIRAHFDRIRREIAGRPNEDQPEGLGDIEALDAMREHLSGREWNAGDLEVIAELLQRTGRTVLEPDDENEQTAGVTA